ncbi:MAG: penicillin-binding transpeptidase domain-containing protein [Lachnospiraceae bacterium]|nr:penicillin-binding transpeptidase domain-containing protein [Lachnospiraceae bacterium]
MLEVKINNTMGRKLVGLFSLVILALVGLAIRITWINVNDGKQYERIVLNQNQQQYESRTIPFKRGDIRDRNGTILATSDKVYNLILDCHVVNTEFKDEDGNIVNSYVDPTVSTLVELFGLDEGEIRGLLSDEKTMDSPYVVLVENMSIFQKQKFEAYTDTSSEENEGLTDAEKKRRKNIKGVWFEEDYLRVYPMNSLACDIIGFSDSDNQANYGIEGYYCDTLNGTNGRQYGYFNDDADVEQTIIDPVAGKNVISTIDVNIQQIIRSAMEKFIQKYSNGPRGEKAAENIGIIVMDPDTGEILGMDSSQWYDLNNPRLYTKEEFQQMPDEQYEQIKDELPEMWKNFCVSDSFEPGSTFKPITVAAAMEMAAADNRDSYYCDGIEQIKNATLHCIAYPGEHGTMNLESALKVSCNDTLMQVGARLGVAGILKYQELFNFGMKTGIDLPGENSGVLHTEEGMGEVELATTSFGQGFTCTMIQEAAAFSAVVNGGYYYKPHVVSAITDSSGAVTEHVDSVVERQVVSTAVSNQVREWLGEVMEPGGSGETANVPGYSLGGKTGTAQKVDPDTKAYGDDYVVSFIGCAPLEKPEVVVYVVVDTPNAEDQGSSIYAQEITREIFIELLPYLNIFSGDPAATEAYIAQLKAAEQSDGAQQADGAEQAEAAEQSNAAQQAVPETADSEALAVPES